MTRTGAQLLVDCLASQGADTAFGVPGESYLAVLDALHDSRIRFVLCRQEGGAAFMAEAYGKLTGRPGLCFVTRGPGATNASIGVHTARQNSTPMILFVGQIGRDMRGREAFQEVDYRAMFGTVAKWAVEIDDAARIPEIVGRAWRVALSGRPGPVVIALPEDMLVDETQAAPLADRIEPAEPACDPAWAVETVRMLEAAKRPLILLGGAGWDAVNCRGREALAGFREWVEAAGLPLAVTFRCPDLFDNASPSYVGDAGVGMPAQVRRMLRECDLLLAINIRFGENTTDGYTLLQVPESGKTLIHVHSSADELGKIYQTPHAWVAGPANFLRALSALPPPKGDWEGWRAEGRGGCEKALTAPKQPGDLDMGEVMKVVRAKMPADGIITNGAGNFAIWSGRFFVYRPGHRLLAPQSGAMGYGIPAAVAAKVVAPHRTVVCFAGDGDFQMTMQELGTAMQADARPVVLVVNNSSYGTIRMHQERNYPGRVSGTDIVNPDFVAIGRAYGMHAEKVEATAQFEAAFGRALASPTGALLELVIATESLTPGQTLSQIRAGGAR
ncbi:thiamine pyrophosphate-binding protein [Limibaculum sp. FT325]|uniref:thiamine pyrophosphate-binding protein n=1 Tax=Thermohalobaculum sediminis TaxID=2939436 RepID=UPI0020BD56F7|nr:thiamine pyrophosphate-binding protein [Limibaculum sediminis]MCL5775744.1 thiamine pyrophosphate-binding protein [Limibaculum sediminis]